MAVDKTYGEEALKQILDRALIKAVMKSPAECINENSSISLAHDKFTSLNLSHLLIVDSYSKLVGLLSPKYLYKARSPNKIIGNQSQLDYDPNKLVDGDSYYYKDVLDKYILHHIMKKNPFSMGPEEPLSRALNNMARMNISCIPIVNRDRRVLGVLTNQEIVNFLVKTIKNH